MRFADKVALITAAANGIGRATADIMAREGAVVVCVDNHPERLETAVQALGARAHGRLCDALDQGLGGRRCGRCGRRIWPDRYTGQCGWRQHDHFQTVGVGRGALIG